MLRSLSELDGSSIHATDGEIGEVKDVWFDDESWTVRYLVVDAGRWLTRKVLISPYSVQQPVGSGKIVDVTLTRQQVKDSPPLETHQPVSRRHERDYLGYYGYPPYWGGVGLWGTGGYPVFSPTRASYDPPPQAPEPPSEDVHLRSAREVRGHGIEASDDSIGDVDDFLFDDETWAVRYLVVDTNAWWPGGKKVLIATRWIDRFDWPEKKVYTSLTRQQVRDSPEYDIAAPVDRGYEGRLHDYYGRPGYWS